MNLLSGSVVGLWIVLLLFIFAVVAGGLWWVMRTRNLKLESDTPANDGEQRHEEFVTRGASEVPPRETGMKG